MAHDDARPRRGRTWLVGVSDGDIAAAKDAWLEAEVAAAPAERVAGLYSDYERLVRTQCRQIAQAFRRANPR